MIYHVIGGKLVDLFVVNVTLLQKMFTPPLHCSLLRCAWYDNHLLQINLTIVIPGASYPAHGSISLLVFSWQGRKVLQNVTSPLSPAVRRPCADYEPVRLRMQFCHGSDQSLECSSERRRHWHLVDERSWTSVVLRPRLTLVSPPIRDNALREERTVRLAPFPIEEWWDSV